MSGGSLGYVSGYIDDAADKVEEYINGEAIDECDIESYIKEHDLDVEESKYIRKHNHTKPNPFDFPDAVLEELKKGLHLLREAAIYAHRLEWLFSGDDGDESFLECLHEDLERLRKGNK